MLEYSSSLKTRSNKRRDRISIQRVLLLRSNHGRVKSADPWEYLSEDEKEKLILGSTSHVEAVNQLTSDGWRLISVVSVRKGQALDTEFWLTKNCD